MTVLIRVQHQSLNPAEQGAATLLVTEFAEAVAGGEVIMNLHVSHAMLSHYSHVRVKAKRRALDEIAARSARQMRNAKNEADRPQHVKFHTGGRLLKSDYFARLRFCRCVNIFSAHR